MKILVALFAFSLFLFSCQRLPKERYSQFQVQTEYSNHGDSIRIVFPNPVDCPLRVTISHTDQAIADILEPDNPRIIGPLQTKELILVVPDWEEEWRSGLRINSAYGSLEHFIEDDTVKYGLPFPKGKEYQIIQGYNGSFSHQEDYSRYAIDFDLQPGDTICAVMDGVVVGVIEGYDVGGNDRKFRPFANYLSIYHANGVLSQYVHLLHDGALVSLGDSITKGQPIALSGETGFTSTPHLHLNFLKPVDDTSISMPVTFDIGPGSSLKRGMTVSHPQ